MCIRDSSYGNEIVATTLTPLQVQAAGVHALATRSAQSGPRDVEVGNENFVATSIDLSGQQQTPVGLTVLKSYDQAAKFLENLNRLLILLGFGAVLVGSGLVFLISYTFTRPLASLVEGVRALEHGDFHHPLDPRGSDEVAEQMCIRDRAKDTRARTEANKRDMSISPSKAVGQSDARRNDDFSHTRKDARTDVLSTCHLSLIHI